HELGPFRDSSRRYDFNAKTQNQLPQQEQKQEQQQEQKHQEQKQQQEKKLEKLQKLQQQKHKQQQYRPMQPSESNSAEKPTTNSHIRQQSESAVPSPASTDQQRFSPIMNRQHRSITVGSNDGSPPAIPDIAYGPASPLVRGRASRRRRSALHDMLERARKRQEQKDQEAVRILSEAASSGNAKPKIRQQHPLSIPQPLSPSDAQAHSLPPEPELAAVSRTVHKAELQFRRPSEDGGSEETRPKAVFTMGKNSRRSPLIQRRVENHALRLMSGSKTSRESMEKGSASPSDSFERLTGVDPLALSKKKSGQFPFRIERTYRVADHSKDSDNEESGRPSDKEDNTSPSSSPLSAVFQLPPVLPPPPQQRDLPPLPAPLQKQLKQLPRLSPPRKLPLGNKPTLQLGLPDPALPISPAGMSQGSNRRVVSGSSLLRSPSNTSFNDIQPRRGMHI
ncbi:hypothetical protein H4S06_003967, partial [Coemansia sp. BCRC 34490]